MVTLTLELLFMSFVILGGDKVDKVAVMKMIARVAELSRGNDINELSNELATMKSELDKVKDKIDKSDDQSKKSDDQSDTMDKSDDQSEPDDGGKLKTVLSV